MVRYFTLLFMSLIEGEMVVQHGDEVQNWYLIQEGDMEVISSHHHELVYMNLTAGQSFGEVGMFITETWECTMRVSSLSSHPLPPVSPLLSL